MQRGLVDECWAFVAPSFLGGQSLGFDFEGYPLDRAPGWRFLPPEVLGKDVLLRAIPDNEE